MAEKTTDVSKETKMEWYRLMLTIRRFEERALKHYLFDGKIRGFCHVYIGQEAVTAGMESALTKDDSIVTGYRQHGIALARGVTCKEAMAELFGKQTGVVKGKGGSMHFFKKEYNYYGGNGIVGAQIPIGAGIGFAEKYRKTKNLSVTMFGDGAARQGSLHESFNMAMTWKLPVIFVCENNQYAMGTSVERTSNVTELYKLGLSYDMPSAQVDGMDPLAVHNAFAKAAEHVRAGNGPYYLEVKTYRYKGHSVSDPAKYRSKDEVKSFQDRDPIKVLEQAMLDSGEATKEEFEVIKKAIKQEIDDAVKFADESPFPPAAELYTDNYSSEYPFLT